ncbi:MAG: hypothetical protein R3236_11675, partial [Phycisphaeraceae bacterium]|nr:hypothetical protein [Phycisphaeraceae bacterium]
LRISGGGSTIQGLVITGFDGNGLVLSGLGGMLFVMDVGSAQPVDFGNFYELYAIAAAVLGGCSLRGGEGAILGVVIGAALMQVLKNMITLVDWIPTNIEFAVIGLVILAGVIADELVKRLAARRRAVREAAMAEAAVSAAADPEGPSQAP